MQWLLPGLWLCRGLQGVEALCLMLTAPKQNNPPLLWVVAAETPSWVVSGEVSKRIQLSAEVCSFAVNQPTICWSPRMDYWTCARCVYSTWSYCRFSLLVQILTPNTDVYGIIIIIIIPGVGGVHFFWIICCFFVLLLIPSSPLAGCPSTPWQQRTELKYLYWSAVMLYLGFCLHIDIDRMTRLFIWSSCMINYFFISGFPNSCSQGTLPHL